MREQNSSGTAGNVVLVVCGAVMLVFSFCFLNRYVVPWARDYISDHYGVVYFPGLESSDFLLIEGVLCVLLGIASSVMGHFINVYFLTAWSDLKARGKSSPSLLTGMSLIMAGIVLIGLHHFGWM